MNFHQSLLIVILQPSGSKEGQGGSNPGDAADSSSQSPPNNDPKQPNVPLARKGGEEKKVPLTQN
jgi:hypothetical protein